MSGFPGGAAPMTAPVIEYACLYSHDLKRKQKRWKDGRLKYHTFNQRVMVYDERGHSIGDMHWQESFPLTEGEEINVDRGGIVVQVCECKGRQHQDLTELLKRRPKRPAPNIDGTPIRQETPRRTPAVGFNPPRPSPRPSPMSAVGITPRPAVSIPAVSSFQTPSRGYIGRAVVPVKTPFEELQAQTAPAMNLGSPLETPAPPSKRRCYEKGEKSTYASSLFGASLNLSGASSAPPTRPPLIPRLLSIPAHLQPPITTSLREFSRQTRPLGKSTSRSNARSKSPEDARRAAPIKPALRSRPAPKVSSKGGGPSCRTTQSNSTSHPNQKNAHVTQGHQDSQPSPAPKFGLSSRPYDPSEPPGKPGLREPLPPTYQLGLGIKKKRKTLMILSAPSLPLPKEKSPTPELRLPTESPDPDEHAQPCQRSPKTEYINPPLNTNLKVQSDSAAAFKTTSINSEMKKVIDLELLATETKSLPDFNGIFFESLEIRQNEARLGTKVVSDFSDAAACLVNSAQTTPHNRVACEEKDTQMTGPSASEIIDLVSSSPQQKQSQTQDGIINDGDIPDVSNPLLDLADAEAVSPNPSMTDSLIARLCDEIDQQAAEHVHDLQSRVRLSTDSPGPQSSLPVDDLGSFSPEREVSIHEGACKGKSSIAPEPQQTKATSTSTLAKVRGGSVRSRGGRGLSSIMARTKGALHMSHMDGFTRVAMPSSSQIAAHHEFANQSRVKDPPKDQDPPDIGDLSHLSPVRRFPGLKIVGDGPWSREAFDLFEWKKPDSKR